MWLFGRDPVRDFGFEMGAAEPDPEPNGVWKRLRGHRKVGGGGGGPRPASASASASVSVSVSAPHGPIAGVTPLHPASRIAASLMPCFMSYVVCPINPTHPIFLYLSPHIY